MLAFRWAMLLLLVASAICFALYAGTGQQRFRKLGLRTLVVALGAGFVFFGVLIAERI